MSSPVQTLLYVFREDELGRQVLLGRKIRGLGLGMIMAPGGHVEPGEPVVSAAVREAQEEVGVTVAECDVERVAVLTYRFPSRPDLDAVVHAFCASRWTGAVRCSDELDPIWFPVSELPLDEMWDDERYWLPRALAGERVTAEFIYDASGTRVLSSSINVG